MSNDNYHNIDRVSLIAKAQGAFLGAAVGDALGWPQEMPAKRADRKAGSPRELLSNGLPQWVRKSGSRLYLHEEVILPGEYSDDTQLLLCTARSLFYGEKWWHHLTKREIPTWINYARGSGGATNRATQGWLTGSEPWSSSKKNEYFEAGGNGVAMRILPHCILGAANEDFREIAKNIVANGICTHGHPRALIGALAYGFALWSAFREIGTLQYGAVIEKVLSGVESWSVLPELDDICPTWRSSAKEVNTGQYKKNWQITVEEMLELLENCQEAMKKGALSVEQAVLRKIGVFGKSKGSGTITAAASIFLASRYAADPWNGLVEAAFADGADTDTMASMTSGLLGAVVGVEWLGIYAEQVQDARYIRELAEDLVKNQGTRQIKFAENIRITKVNLNSFIAKLEASQPGDTLLLPDGREAQTSAPRTHQPLSQATLAVSWKLITADGQSLYIKKLSREKTGIYLNVKTPSSNVFDLDKAFKLKLQPIEVTTLAVKLAVRDFSKSRFFYEKVLGLKVQKETSALVNYGSLVLVMSTYEKSLEQQLPIPIKSLPTICLEINFLEAAYENVCKFGSRILKPISERRRRRLFSCLDPDQNTVEIYEIEF
jgi:ADP-ribosylglycohydrolase/predicted enzyme related to lactoylglutathione lyase